VIRTIARREIMMALRRRLVKMLFLASLVPPVVVAIVLVVRLAAKHQGFELEWDPLLRFFVAQTGPVLLLALGIGTPSVSRDRAEDVLFLYATRPVTPFSYALGKMLAVVAPATALFLLPGLVIAFLRHGLLGSEVTAAETTTLILKVTLAAALMGWGFAGISVGPSAATKKARWALLLALACFVVPDGISDLVWFDEDTYALGPGRAVKDLLSLLFAGEEGWVGFGVVGAIVLAVYGALGVFVTQARVKREMTP
jgi:hypothetical protein